MRLRARLAVLSVTSILVPLFAGLGTPAVADEALTAYAPARESHVRTPPSQIRLVFADQITNESSIALEGPVGPIPCVVTSPTPLGSSSVLACRPSASQGEGVYTVSFTGVYDDGTTPDYTESYTFTLDVTPPPAPSDLAATPDPYLADSGELVVSGETETETDTVYAVITDGTTTLTRTNNDTTKGESTSFTVPFSEADMARFVDGDLTITSYSRDRAVNDGPESEITLLKDTSAPTVVSSTPADAGTVAPTGLTYSVVASEALGAASEVTVFDSGDAPVTAPVAVDGDTVTATPSSNLANGTYRAEIDLVDVNGNSSSETRTFTVDNTSIAAAVLTSRFPGGVVRNFPTRPRLIFDRQITPESTIALFEPDGTPIECPKSSPVTNNTSGLICDTTDPSAYPDGEYTLTYRAVPANGGPATEDTYTWRLDSTPPPAPANLAVSVDPYTVAEAVAGTDVVLTGQTENAVDGIFASITDGTTTIGESNGSVAFEDRTTDIDITFDAADFATLADGLLTVSARSRDTALNNGPDATITMRKDTTAPSVRYTDPGDGSTVALPTGPFTFTAFADEQLGDASTVRLLDAASNPVNAVVEVDGDRVVATTGTAQAPLPAGTYTAQIDLVDEIGNAADTVTVTFTVGDAPRTTARLPVKNGFSRTFPSQIRLVFDRDITSASTVSVAGPDGEDLTCIKTAPTTPLTPGSVLSCNPAGVASGAEETPDGVYSVTFTAVPDGGGPSATETYFFTLDTVAPPAPENLAADPSPYLFGAEDLIVSGQSEERKQTVFVEVTDGTRTVTATNGLTKEEDNSRDFAIPVEQADMATLADGPLTVRARVRDRAVNDGPFASIEIVKDTALPTVVETDPADGGAANSAGFTYVVTASEDLDTDDSTVRLFDATDTEIASTVTVAGDTITADPGTLPDGEYRAEIDLKDVAGNVAETVETTFTIDDTAPDAPTVDTPLAVINAANAAAYEVSGEGEPGSTVEVTVTDGADPAGTVTGTAVVGIDGSWTVTIDASTLADGDISVTATQTDLAGNTSDASDAATTTKDTVAPELADVAVTPAESSAAAPTATVTGTVNDGADPAAGEAAAVQVTANDTDPLTDAVVVDGTSAGDGSFSIEVDLSALSDGEITYDVVASDDAGNPSEAAQVTNELDTDAPTQPTVTVTPDPIGAADDEAVTIAGDAVGADTVAIVISDSDDTTDDVTVEGLAVNDDAYTVDVDLSGLVDGPLTVSVTGSDTAGNTSPAGTATPTKDTVAPDAPTLTLPTFTGDTLTVSGTAEPGATVQVTVTDGADPAGTATGSIVADGEGNWSVDIDVSDLAEGTLDVAADATDAAGNTGPETTGTTIKDTVAPDAPATLVGDPDPYLPDSTTLTITGTTTAGDQDDDLTVDVVVSDGNDTTDDLVIDDVAVTPGTPGSFEVVLTSEQVRSLADGTLTITASFTDAAGNTGNERADTVLKDASELALVSTSPADGATVQAPATISATFNEAITSTTGDPAETRSTIVVRNRLNVQVAGTRSVNGTTISFTPSSALTEAGSPYSVDVTAYDADNPAESTDADWSFAVDTTAPAAPTVLVTDPVTIANQDAVVVTGDAGEPDLTVSVDAGGVMGTATSNGDGVYSVTLDLSGVPDGTVQVSATSMDATGNTSPAGTATTIKDATAPSLVRTNPEDGDTVTGSTASISFTYDEELGTGSTITTDPAVDGETTVDGDTVTFTPDNGLPDGDLTATADVTDGVGNPASDSIDLTVDATAPDAPVVDQAADVTIAEPALSLTGTAEPSTTVDVTVVDSAREGEPVSRASAGGTTVADDQGDWSLLVDVDSMAEGDLTISATATDGVGNVSLPSNTVQVLKDTVAPVVTDLAATDAETEEPITTVTGTRSETSEVAITATSGEMTAEVQVPSGDGDFSVDIDLSGFAPGTVLVTAAPVDGVANQGEDVTTTLELSATQTDTSITLERSTHVVRFGQTVTMSGVVTREDTSVEPGDVQLVAITRRNEVVNLGTVPVAADGSFSSTLRPSVDAIFVAGYEGDARNSSSRSEGERVKVRFAVSSAVKRLNKRNRALINGSILPSRKDVEIKVFLVRSNGKRLLNETTTGNRGNYKVRINLPQKRNRILIRAVGTLDNTRGTKRLTIRR